MDLDKYESEQKILVSVDCIILGFDGGQLKGAESSGRIPTISFM